MNSAPPPPPTVWLTRSPAHIVPCVHAREKIMLESFFTAFGWGTSERQVIQYCDSPISSLQHSTGLLAHPYVCMNYASASPSIMKFHDVLQCLSSQAAPSVLSTIELVFSAHARKTRNITVSVLLTASLNYLLWSEEAAQSVRIPKHTALTWSFFKKRISSSCCFSGCSTSNGECYQSLLSFC